MKIKKLVKLAPMMLLTFLLGLSGCSGSTSADARVNDHPNEADEELHVLTIGTADSGGTMYPVGSAIASVLSGHDEQLKVNLSASNGSYTNVENIKNGQFDIGLVSGDVAFSAYQGTDEFSGHPVESLRAIGAVYSSLSTWMAPESEHISYVHELAGHHIAVGPEGSTTELSARTALKAAGLNIANTALENYSFSASVDSVLNGKLDAVHSFAGIPVHSLTDLGQPDALPPCWSTLTKNCKNSCSQPLLRPRHRPSRYLSGTNRDTENLRNQMPSLRGRIHGRTAGLHHHQDSRRIP